MAQYDRRKPGKPSRVDPKFADLVRGIKPPTGYYRPGKSGHKKR